MRKYGCTQSKNILSTHHKIEFKTILISKCTSSDSVKVVKA